MSQPALGSPATGCVTLQLTNHARGRMVDRGVRFPEMVEALTSDARIVRDAEGVTLFGVNGVALVLDLTMTLVITVLPRGTGPARWRGGNEGIGGYRRDPSRRRNRSLKRSSMATGHLSVVK